MEFADEELNYYRLIKIVTRIVPENLRDLFKQEWERWFGPWNDQLPNYTSFSNMESPRNRRQNQRLLGLMKNGNRHCWDSTCLFYAIMYSDSVGPKLKPVVKNSVNDLRESRNDIAHNPDGRVTKADFQASIQKILTAFTALKFDTTKIEELKNQTTFPTMDLNSIKQDLNSIKQELEDEKKRNAEPSSFCVLPPKPSHDTIIRRNEVENTFKEMKRLTSENKGETTVVYLSGNPGCGKSVLARQIGEKHFVSDENENLTFVMTIDASNLDAMLEWYVEFAVKLKCCPDSITHITTSKDLSKDNQIMLLKALANKQVDKYASWLIIIDNVTDLKAFSKYWPQCGEKTSGIGQILVTTQDTRSIALTSHSKHMSLKNGMTENDAIQVLSKVSSLMEDHEMMLKVAKTLDFQPLALACAGVYMCRVRTTNTLFTWQQYLQKLEEGKRQATEKVYEETSLNYPMTMTVAVQLALQREVKEDKIMQHAFDFLSVIAQKPIPLQYVVQYVINCMPDEDENLVAASIALSSLVIISSDEAVKVINLHPVVHQCLQNNKRHLTIKDMVRVISTFQQLESINIEGVSSIIQTRPLVVHFEAIAERLIVPSGLLLRHDDNSIANYLLSIGGVCHNHGKYYAAKTYYENALAIYKISYGENHPSVGDTLNNLGNTLQKLGQYDKAKIYYENALAIYKSAYGEKNSSVGDTLNNIGATLEELGEYEKAKICYENALAIHKTAYGENHPSVGDTLNNLGTTIRHLGEYEKAKTYHENALAIYKTAFGENHPSVGETFNILGITLRHLEEYEKAKFYYENALAIKKTAYGENHPSIGNTLNNLGTTLRHLGEYEKAKTYHENALVIYKTAFGENHPSLGRILKSLGKTLQKQGEYEKAKITKTA